MSNVSNALARRRLVAAVIAGVLMVAIGFVLDANEIGGSSSRYGFATAVVVGLAIFGADRMAGER